MTGIGWLTFDVVAAGDDRIDGILTTEAWDGRVWQHGPIRKGYPVPTINYTFPVFDETRGYPGNAFDPAATLDLDQLIANFVRASPEQRAAAHFALDKDIGSAASAHFALESLISYNIKFSNYNSTAQIKIAATQHDFGAPARAADFPNNSVTQTMADNGDLWFFNSGWSHGQDYGAPLAGNYEWHTHLHELGHALGLKHGHDAAGGVTSIALPADSDSMEFSVMTYRSFINQTPNAAGHFSYTNETWGYAQTWMMLDIAALQHLYGARYDTNDEDTWYSWSPRDGRTWINDEVAIEPGNGDGTETTIENRIFATIWDGGGRDTYDLTAYNTPLEIDLRPGHHSLFSDAQLARLHQNGSALARGNIFNALLHNNDPRSLIENARGGTSHDILRGNRGDNDLFGGPGDDTLMGFDGADRLYGGYGNDKFYFGNKTRSADGGHGEDTAVFRWKVDLDFDTYEARIAGGHQIFIVNIEHVRSSSFSDILMGDGRNNIFHAGDGGDRVFGRAGNDIVYGQRGTDFLFGGDGDDLLIGSHGDDRVHGGQGVDVLSGGVGNDYLWGDDHNDRIVGGMHNDQIRGGQGDDLLFGNSGKDLIIGGDGRDRLFGNSGPDTLYGGKGADRLLGGEGDDIFLFKSVADSGRDVHQQSGVDRILDFEGAGESTGDIIDLSGINANPASRNDTPFSWAEGYAGYVSLFEIGEDTVVSVRVRSIDQRRIIEGGEATYEGQFQILIEDGDTRATEYTVDDFIL